MDGRNLTRRFRGEIHVPGHHLHSVEGVPLREPIAQRVRGGMDPRSAEHPKLQ